MFNAPRAGRGGSRLSIGVIAVHQREQDHLATIKDVAYQMAHNVAHAFGVYEHDRPGCKCDSIEYENLDGGQYCMMDRRFSRDLNTPKWSDCSKKNVIDYFAGDRLGETWNVDTLTDRPRIRFQRPGVEPDTTTIPLSTSQSDGDNGNSSPQPSNQPNQSQPSTKPLSNKKRTLAIVFGVIGGVILLAAIISIAIYVSKRGSSAKKSDGEVLTNRTVTSEALISHRMSRN